MASSPPAESLAPRHSLHGRCAFCRVHSGRSGPSSTHLRRQPHRHSIRSCNLLMHLKIACVGRLRLSLVRQCGQVMLVPRGSTAITTAGLQKLPFGFLAQTVESRAQNDTVKPLFCFTFLPGFSTVPLADASCSSPSGPRRTRSRTPERAHAPSSCRILSNTTNLTVQV